MSATENTFPLRRPRGAGRRRSTANRRVWIFGIHAVRAALLNPARSKHRLIVTQNAASRMAAEIDGSGTVTEIADPRKFPAPLAANSVHQGAALEADPLVWPDLKDLCGSARPAARIVLLDRVTDPHNVGAVLRSASAFGADAVIVPARHAPPETGALAKSASGALESVPYLRVRNLSAAMKELREAAFMLIGFDSAAPSSITDVRPDILKYRLGLTLGAESAGLREGTRKTCDLIFRICPGSLNVSNAAAVSLFATQRID